MLVVLRSTVGREKLDEERVEDWNGRFPGGWAELLLAEYGEEKVGWDLNSELGVLGLEPATD